MAQTPTPTAKKTTVTAPASANATSFKNFKEAYDAGNLAYKDQKWEEAAGDYAQAASLALNDKSKSQALNSQGWALIKQKKWKSAQTVLDQAVKADETNKLAAKNLGVASFRIYEFGFGGVEDLKTAILDLEAGGDSDMLELAKGAETREESYAQVTPETEPKLEGMDYKALSALGNKVQAQGRFDLALKIFKKAGEVAHSAVSKGQAANLQGKVLLDARRPHESIPYFEEAVKDQPNEKVYLNNLGYSYLEFYDSGKGDEETLKKAVDAFYKANAIDPSFHKDNLVMALAELKEVDPDAAKQYSASTEKTGEAAPNEASTETSTPSATGSDTKPAKGNGTAEGKSPK
jgi:tetratricopeptide (TPR) repeat protein